MSTDIGHTCTTIDFVQVAGPQSYVGIAFHFSCIAAAIDASANGNHRKGITIFSSLFIAIIAIIALRTCRQDTEGKEQEEQQHTEAATVGVFVWSQYLVHFIYLLFILL